MTQVVQDYRMSLVAELSAVAETAASWSWRDQAACAGYDTKLFYAESGSRDERAIALSVCQRCPVRNECLEEALTVPERFGIWGGLTELQRRRLWTDRPSGARWLIPKVRRRADKALGG
jgi:WhiB family redox-sensing transcriptional regulator